MSALASREVLKLGDRVRFDQAEHTVVGLSGTAVRLQSQMGVDSVVLLSHLLSWSDFEVIGGAEQPSLTSLGLLEAVPPRAREMAMFWERHIVEVETGLPPEAEAGAEPREEYDPAVTTVEDRVAAKACELAETDQPVSVRTLHRMRQRYREQGVWGLVDQRATRQQTLSGRVDPRVITALTVLIEAETGDSTGTKSRLRRRVEQALADEYGLGVVPMPSRATFDRLAGALTAGRHTFGSAVTRRQAANRPAGAFTLTAAARPGEQVQIDTTPLDVLAVLDDGVTGRVELTIAVDVATRTICAAVLRPAGTKAVDAAVLLARMLVPEPMRPGWSQALAMKTSRLPHARLLDIDRRLELAAAKPVIVPDTVVCDRGKVFLSEAFQRACRHLGISVQPAHPRTPTDKAVVERTFASINTLFCQHVAGYVGRDVTRRGEPVEAVWTLAELQDLLDEWIVAGWQPRPHQGLRHPRSPQLTLSPNDMYACPVAAAGYLPLTLTGEDYIELLPVTWRAINDYGIQIDYRTYDDEALNPYRRQSSPIEVKRGLWPVHYDPYDLSRVWLRGPDGWITIAWTHAAMVPQPFADFTWRHARKLAAATGRDDTDQTELAWILADLLKRADAGPAERRIRARTKAATGPSPHRLAITPVPDDLPEQEDASADDHGAQIIPFGVFDPFSDQEYL
ncbi:Mu transposase C-terminal domain-containing protein [Planomonospora algeriensis]